MDDNNKWRFRVMRAMRFSKHKDPFYECKKIGMDFNIASKRKQKLDLKLLTNGAVIEIFNFGKLLSKKATKRQFLYDILDNNFDFRLKSEQDRIYFFARIQQSIKQKSHYGDKRECFSLPESFKFGYRNTQSQSDNYKNDQTLASAEYIKTESMLMETDELCAEHVKTESISMETDELCAEHVKTESTSMETNELCAEHIKPESMSMETDEFCASHIKPESISMETDEVCAAETEDGDEVTSPRTASTKGDLLPCSYPFCEEIGLSFSFGAKQTLDLGFLTNGVMSEIIHVATAMCRTYRQTFLDVLEHNFEIDFTSQNARRQALGSLQRFLNRKKNISNGYGEEMLQLKREIFTFYTDSSEGGRATSSRNKNKEGPPPKYHFKEVIKKRQADLRNNQTKVTLLKAKRRKSQKCRGNVPKHIKKNTALKGIDLHTSQMVRRDQGLSNEHSDVHPLGESNLDSDSEQLVSPVQTQITVNSQVPNDRDTMEQKEIGADQLMWRLRTKRTNQILSRPGREYCTFSSCKKIGLDFNVGSGIRQSLAVKSFNNIALVEVAKFAIAMNSSQQDFIMEILEYNFDFGFNTEEQRHVFACETMHRVKQLTDGEDDVKLSKEAFELPVHKLNKLTTKTAYDCDLNISFNPEMSSVLGMKVYEVVPVSPADASAETQALVTEKEEDQYPHCKEIGLKLQVNEGQTNKKLDFNMLTKGAMIEVANFANMLCGTFEQILLDVLGHNYDLDLQNGKSETAKYILEQLPVIIEQKNLSNHVSFDNNIRLFPIQIKRPDGHNNPGSDTADSQTPITGHNLDSCTEVQQKVHEYDKTLWKLRARRSQHILSVPHREGCPFYPFSRCKKIGIDFNVGSGVKQNLDPKLLTNGVMAELTLFAGAMRASQREFMVDILECNFDLGLKNDLQHRAFAFQIMIKLRSLSTRTKRYRMNNFFELPDPTCFDESEHVRAICCPKCYQDRNLDAYGKDECDPDAMHKPSPHARIGAVLTDEHHTAQGPVGSLSSTFSTTEGSRINTYPHCSKIGLRLYVDGKQRREKLGLHLLTLGAVIEVSCIAKELCGRRREVVNDILQHNFNLGVWSRDGDPASQFFLKIGHKLEGPAWFNEVFSFQPFPKRLHFENEKWKILSVMPKSQEWKKTMEERQFALQRKKELATSANKAMCPRARKKVGHNFPLCENIGLDLNVESKSGPKAKLDLNLLTRAVVYEIHKYVSTRLGVYYPSVLYDILAYNFDLSSQDHRQWEFSLTIAQKVKDMARKYRKNLDKAENVFKLPFVIPSKGQKQPRKSVRDESKTQKNPRFSLEEPDSDCEKEHRCAQELRCHPDVSNVYFLDQTKPLVKEEEEFGLHDGSTESSAGVSNMTFSYKDTGITEAEAASVHGNILKMNKSTVTADFDRLLQDNGSFNTHIKEEKYDPQYGIFGTEFKTEDLGLVPSATPGPIITSVRSMCQDTESKLTSDDTGGSGWHHGDASHPENKVDIKRENVPLYSK